MLRASIVATILFVTALYFFTRPASPQITAEATSPQPISAAKAQPEYGWVRSDETTVEFGIAELRRWPVPVTGRVQLKIESERPVDVVLEATTCRADRVLSKTLECEIIGPSSTMIARDDRMPTTEAAKMGAALWTRSARLAESTVTPNRVRFELSTWGCIASCPQP